MLTFGSLFAGIGGFDLGFERAGMTCKWQVEIDDYCQRVLEKHWPNVARYEDVRECGAENLEPVDLICGGFPCQDLSVAGKRRGIHGEQSGLFFEFVRLACELRPAWLVIENVPGLLSSNDGRDMGIVIGTLEDAGYMGAWRVLDSQWFGVAQRRRRLFIVCHSDGRRAGAVLFEPEGGAGHSQTVRKAGADIAHALDARSGGVSAKDNQATLVFNWQAGGTRDFTGCSDKPGAIHAGQTPAITYALNAHGGIDGESETFIAHALSHEGEDGTGRGTPLVAPSLRCGGREQGAGSSYDNTPIVAPCLTGETRATGTGHGDRGAPIVGAEADAHRVREVAGLPRRLDGKRYRALGNAVTVPVLEWLGRRIVAVEANS